MNAITRAVAATIILLGFAGAAQAEPLRIGIAAEPYPPFATPDASGNYVGWEIEIANAVCAAGGFECEFVTTAWDGIIPAQTANKFDVIAASLSITAERMKTIDFSNKYYQTGAAIIGSSALPFEPTPEGVEGKTIGVQSASIHQAYAGKYFSGATIKAYQTQDEVNQDVFAGRIDGTIADVLVLDAFLESDEGKACCDLKGLVANDETVLGKGIGFGIRKGEDALKEKLNAAIDTIRADGTYDKISAGYFDFNIFGE